MRLNYTLDPYEPLYDDDTFGRLWDALIARHRETGGPAPPAPHVLPPGVRPLPSDAIDGQLSDQGAALLGHTVHLSDLLTKAFHAASALEFGRLFGRPLPPDAPHQEAVRAAGREATARLWVVAVRTSQLLRDYQSLPVLAAMNVPPETLRRWREAVPRPDDETMKDLWHEPDEDLVRRYRLPDFFEPHRQFDQALAAQKPGRRVRPPKRLRPRPYGPTVEQIDRWLAEAGRVTGELWPRVRDVFCTAARIDLSLPEPDSGPRDSLCSYQDELGRATLILLGQVITLVRHLSEFTAMEQVEAAIAFGPAGRKTDSPAAGDPS